MKRVLVTGASGFVGSALLTGLPSTFAVSGTYCANRPVAESDASLDYRHMDLNDGAEITAVCHDIKADVVVHAAAVSERSRVPIRLRRYRTINEEGTERLARAAVSANPAVRFVYLSTTAVYGESPGTIPINENHPCNPLTEYAKSKYLGECTLTVLARNDVLRGLTILRLPPLYDKSDIRAFRNRVKSPVGNLFVRYGKGTQLFSALALPNLIDFVSFLASHRDARGPEVFHVCDAHPYRFDEVRHIISRKTRGGTTPCITVPRGLASAFVVTAGALFPSGRTRFMSYYGKLFHDLVFDCGRMHDTGFRPVHAAQTVLAREESDL